MVKAPTEFSVLVRAALDRKDIYAAAALHPWANHDERAALEALWLEQRQNALRLAQLELTPPSVLESLVTLNDPAVGIRLAKHPRTPATVLENLFRASQGLSDRKRLRQLLAMNTEIPSWVLLNLAENEEDEDTLKGLCANSGADPEVLEKMTSRGIGGLQTLLAVNLATDAALLERLWGKGSDAIRAQILGHPHCPEALLGELPSTPLQRRKLAANVRAPDVMLQNLARDGTWNVRRAAAGNPSLPAKTLEALCRDESDAVRRVVSLRTDLPVACIEAMASDGDEWVRQGIGRNQVTPAHCLAWLAADPAMEVRRAVARNPACPMALVKQLAVDVDQWVRAGVAYRQDLTAGLLRDLERNEQSVNVLSGVAQNRATSQRALQQLSQHPDPDVRRGVIINKSAKRSVLRKLLSDPYGLHRGMIFSHPNLQEQDRWSLWRDPESRVRFAVFRHFGQRLGGERK